MGHIVVELTNRCNLACRHCFPGRHGGRDDLKEQVFEQILSQARGEGFQRISFTGGEPTLHPRFIDFAVRAAQAGYSFGFVTNGRNFADVLSRLDSCDARPDVVAFSLDGATEHSHDRLRGKGSYREVMKGLSVCVVQHVPFTLNTVITGENQDEIEPMADLAFQLGSHALRFAHWIPSPSLRYSALGLSIYERRRAESEIRRLQADGKIPIIMAPGFYTENLFPCAALQAEELNVDCRGNVTLCCHLSSYNSPGDGAEAGQGDAAGNLSDIDFHEAVQRLQRIREVFQQHKRNRAEEGSLRDADFFPCGYCTRYFKADGPQLSSDLVSISQPV